MEICIIGKSKKIHGKNCKLILSGTVDFFAHNTIQSLKYRTLFKYENARHIC